VQDTLPSRSLYSFVGHAEHESDPTAELYSFTSHLLHSSWPVEFAAVPAGHSPHTAEPAEGENFEHEESKLVRKIKKLSDLGDATSYLAACTVIAGAAPFLAHLPCIAVDAVIGGVMLSAGRAVV
jgi:hypothetical protein